MVADHRYQHLETVRSVLAGAIAPLRYAVDLPATWLGWTSERMTGREELLARIHELERNNIELRARQQRLETLQSENRRLRQLLQSSAKREDRVRVAE
ncbi:MAG: rod shape-determining protein MreC, partial [Gammaproteobacteria bacterium]|nr:rod shape-determining protein MreC [Gammaproteobacteria bacterium]